MQTENEAKRHSDGRKATSGSLPQAALGCDGATLSRCALMSEEVLGGEPRRTVKRGNVRIVSPMFGYVVPVGPGSTQKADGAPGY